MRKLSVLLMMLPFLFVSCGDDESTTDDQYKEVKVTIERTSTTLDVFYGGDVLTIPIDKKNTVYDSKQFDQVIDNTNENILLMKVNNVLIAKQEFTLSQKKVSIQILDTPQIENEIKESTDADVIDQTYSLNTKIKITVDGKTVKEQSYKFSASSANANLLLYAE